MSVDQYEYDQLLKEANDYFSERYVVTATQMMNEVPEQITFAEFDQMKKMGKRVMDVVRKNAGDDDILYDQLMSEANLVMFPTEDKKGEPSEAAIPAGKLVEWVKRTRGKYESDAKTEEKFSDFAKNEQYREAVMVGVSAMVSSPFVTGMPYKLNAGGEQESFADGIPPSLQLATALEAKDRADYATFKAKLVAKEGPSRSGFVDNKGDDYQDKVALDQERNEEFFTPEDRAIRELEVGDTRGVRSKRRSRKDDTRAAAEATDVGGELVTRGAGRGIGLPIRVDISGSVEAEPKTGDPGATEMDFFRDQKPGEVPDDFADQQFHTKQTMEAFALPKSKMAAFRGAKRTAEELTALMGSNPQRAREVIMAHLRTAMQGEAYNPSGVVGDAYHIAPIINMLDKGKNPKNPDAKSNFERLQAAGAPPNLIDGMERAALTVLIRAADGRNEISDAHLKSLYMTLEGVNDNLKQMQAKLAKRGAIDLNKLGAYVSPKRPAAPAVDVSTKPLGQNPSRATETVDEDNPPSGSTSFKRTPNKIVGAPGEASRTVSQEFVDRQTAKVTAGGVPKAAPKKVESVVEGKDPGAIPMYYKMPPQAERAGLRSKYPDANREQQPGEGFDSPESPLLNGPQDLADREAKYQRKNAASGVGAGLGKPLGGSEPLNVWHGSGENAALSNLAARPFTVNGRDYVSVEHAYQSTKSGAFDQETYDKYKTAGRKIPGKLGTKSEGGWNLRLMKKLVKASFEQNPEAAAKLAATGDASITHTQDSGVWAAEFPRILMEVRAELSGTSPGTPRGGVDLGASGPYAAKDQAKSDRATKFIGRGSPASSTAKYAKAWGDKANSGTYTATDKVFVSAEGNRSGRMNPDFAELKRAMSAGATIITDNSADRARMYNLGERQVAAHLTEGGYAESAPGTWTPARKLNAMVGQGLADSREVMRTLGFKSAPEQFADVASKLLVDPGKDLKKFAEGAANGLSHILMDEKYVGEIKAALADPAWTKTLSSLTTKFVGEGMKKDRAELEAYRTIVEQALRGEIAARTISERTAVGKIMQLVKDFVSKFKHFTGSAEFADVVRTQLNKAVADAKGPIDLKANYRKVSFQEAVDADPTAAKILAHMSKNPNIAITGSIVLAHNGTIYRDSQNMLHDLDFMVQGSKDAAEAHMRKMFPDAVQIYDFRTPESKVDTFLVPPPGATIADIERKGYGKDKGRVVAFKVMRDGKEIGRTWNDSKGEKKLGEAGTFVDLFTESGNTPASTIPFTTGGAEFSIKASGVADIFQAKHNILRQKDVDDYIHFIPDVGRTLNQQAGKFEGWKAGPTAGPSQVLTQAEMDEATDYVKKVLGPKIKVEFKNITGYSGEFIDATNTIVVSTTAAAGTMGTIYHEALHVFFRDFVKGNPELLTIFKNLVDNEKHMERLNALLDGYPAAQAQLVSGEERLAYTYQFWKAGLIQVDAKATARQ